MKIPCTIAILTTLLPFMAHADGRKVAIRDAVSHEDLAKARFDRPEPFNQVEPMPEVRESPPPREWNTVNILERSEFLSYNGLGTLVPKGSLLHVPGNLRDRVHMADGVRIVPWAEFYRFNRNWIKTHEVSRNQAEGNEEFTEAALESISRSSSVVIATLSTGPITVLPPAAPEEEGQEAATHPETSDRQTP